MAIKIDDEIGIWGISASRFEHELKNETGDVEIIIDSPGGDVFEGIQIYNAIKEYDKGKVSIVINSQAFSIASYIAMAGDSISAKSNATFMIHNVWTVAIGDHNELRKTADVAEGLTALLSAAYAARTGKSKDEILSMMSKVTYLFGKEITEWGFADETINVEDDTEKMAALAVARERFKAARKHMQEHAEDASVEKMAALLRNTAKEEVPVISREMLARRFKLLTGERV